MGRVIRKLNDYASGLLGSGLLVHGQGAFLAAVLLQFLATALSGVFINTFLYTAGLPSETGTVYSLRSVVDYNLCFCLSVCFFSAVVGVLGGRMRAKAGMMLGLAFYAAVYVLLTSYDKHVGQYAWLLGILGGLGSSFYAISYNTALVSLTAGRTRGAFVALSSLGTAACSVVAPLVAGFVAEYVPRMGGYIGVFAASLILLTASGIVLLLLVSPPAVEHKEGLLRHILRPARSRAFAAAAAAETVRGLFGGVMAFLAPILLVVAGAGPALVGVYACVCAGLQILSGLYVGRCMTEQNRFGYLVVACTVLCVCSFLFLINLGPVTVFLYGALTSLTYAQLMSPSFEIYYRAVGSIPDSVRRTGSDMASRECYLNLGRSLGVFCFLLASRSTLIPYLIALLGLAQMLVPVLYRLADRWAAETEQD